MVPEILPVPSAAPINWGLEVAKLLVPPILTGVTVLTGAAITYRYATRGRKEDILFKERYKGFEQISSYCHDMKRLALDLRLYHSVIVTEGIQESIVKFASENNPRILKAYKDIPNTTNAVLLSDKSKALLNELIQIVESLNYFTVGIIQNSKPPEFISKEDYQKIRERDLNEMLDKLLYKSQELATQALIDVDLPKR